MERLGAKTRFQAGLLLGRMNANSGSAEQTAAQLSEG
jgi:hypothetical protein